MSGMADGPGTWRVPRQYPVILRDRPARRPISFVVVHYSDDVFHNIMQSACVHDSLNELVVVDNRHNLFHKTLSAAIRDGIKRAKHSLIAVVHEDVLLPAGWQSELESSIDALERHDPDWSCLGSVGWTAGGQIVGHWSDPYSYCCNLSETPYAEVAKLDEQLLIVREDQSIGPDPSLPGIHNIGRDLPLSAMAAGLKTYVVNAPTIHKYADSLGNPILSPADSPKIQARKTLTWLADKDCSDDYVFRKWTSETPPGHTSAALDTPLDGDAVATMPPPIVFLARGGGGSRLLSVLGADAGIFLGNSVNAAGDTVDMINPIYKSVIEKYQCVEPWQQALPPQELRRGALKMLEIGGFPALWGFKLPEAMLIVPEILAAFPGARFVHLIRDPYSCCLRRTHMTGRLDNEIGRIALPLAYRYHQLAAAQILDDSPALHMAYTTRHQLFSVLASLAELPPVRCLELRFEEMMHSPGKVNRRFRRWLEENPLRRLAIGARDALDSLIGKHHASSALEQTVDPRRAAAPAVHYPPEVEANVMAIVSDLRARLGYHQRLPAGVQRRTAA